MSSLDANDANDDLPRDDARIDRLSRLDDYKVADGYPDIRGWDVTSADGTRLGHVEDLVVDTAAMRVRYVDVKLADGQYTLLPIGGVQLDEGRDYVLVGGMTPEALAALPRYDGERLTPDYERSVRDHLGVASDYEHAAYDDQRAFAGRRAESVGEDVVVRMPAAQERRLVETDVPPDVP